MKYKDKLLEEYLKEPIKIGDSIKFQGEGNGSKNKELWATGKVIEIDGDIVTFDAGYSRSSGIHKRHISEIKKDTYYIGCNPFPEKPWNSSMRIVAFALDSILHTVGFERRKSVFSTEKFGEVIVQELNWNPFIIDSKTGNEIRYQRDFVWTLENKQLLIDSIYNSIDIGKIVVRKRGYKWVERRVKEGKEACFKDIVDGKQRLNAILEFIQDEFTDSKGFYFSDLSDKAKNSFFNFSSIGYGEIGEEATDQDVLDVFLGVNFTGVPMSKEHIEYVQSIKI